jgi:hypothetical protein
MLRTFALEAPNSSRISFAESDAIERMVSGVCGSSAGKATAMARLQMLDVCGALIV